MRLVERMTGYDGAIHMSLMRIIDGADSNPCVSLRTDTANLRKRFHEIRSGNSSARFFEACRFDSRTEASCLDDSQNFRTNERHFTVKVVVILISVERLIWAQQSTVCTEVQRNFWILTWNHHETFLKLCT